VGEAVRQPARRSPSGRDAALAPSLATALAQLLPGRDETALLTTLLHRGESARAAWQRFCAAVPDLPSAFRLDSGGWKRLSPLLLVALRESAVEADAALRTVLRTAYLREELRSRAYREVAGVVLGALRDAGLRFLVLKGAALSETVYGSPVLRHAHDVDLLVASADAGVAAEVMARAGLVAGRPLRDDQGRRFQHRSGLPFLLHRRLHRLSYYRADFDTLWARAAAARVADVEVRVPGDADQLLHVLGHAASSASRATLQWVADAWMLLHAAGGVDWAEFPARVRESRLELPVYTLLSYLGRELAAPVPGPALDGLGDLAARARGGRRDVALLGVRQRPVEAASPGPAARDWRTRLTLLRWRTLPSPEYMRWRYGSSRSAAALPILYLERFVDYAGRRLAGVVRRCFATV
jgi:hypothetical protein